MREPSPSEVKAAAVAARAAAAAAEMVAHPEPPTPPEHMVREPSVSIRVAAASPHDVRQQQRASKLTGRYSFTSLPSLGCCLRT